MYKAIFLTISLSSTILLSRDTTTSYKAEQSNVKYRKISALAKQKHRSRGFFQVRQNMLHQIFQMTWNSSEARYQSVRNILTETYSIC